MPTTAVSTRLDTHVEGIERAAKIIELGTLALESLPNPAGSTFGLVFGSQPIVGRLLVTGLQGMDCGLLVPVHIIQRILIVPIESVFGRLVALQRLPGLHEGLTHGLRPIPTTGQV
jgi:hypothetical protein